MYDKLAKYLLLSMPDVLWQQYRSSRLQKDIYWFLLCILTAIIFVIIGLSHDVMLIKANGDFEFSEYGYLMPILIMFRLIFISASLLLIIWLICKKKKFAVYDYTIFLWECILVILAVLANMTKPEWFHMGVTMEIVGIVMLYMIIPQYNFFLQVIPPLSYTFFLLYLYMFIKVPPEGMHFISMYASLILTNFVGIVFSRELVANEFYLYMLYQEKEELVKKLQGTTAMLEKNNLKLQREKERVVYYERELRKREVTRAEMKTLQAQIKPHFIFNALSTIAYYCRNKPKHAHELLYHLSTYLRSMFNQQCDEISLQEELNTVRSYLAIESARMEGRLKIDFRLNGCFDQCYFPAFTLQPLVENAVRHGLAPLMAGGTLIIEGREEAVAYCFSVSDNGIGIPEENLKGLFDEHLNRKGGIGLTNVHKRLLGLYGSGLTLNSCPGKTVVMFSIPKKERRQMKSLKPKAEV